MSVTYDITNTLRANTKHHEPIILEHHPNDSRIKIDDSGICQTLSSRMGTGGGNVPLIMEIHDDDIERTNMLS